LENKKKLYVGNLPYTTTADELKTAFGEFGEITDAVIISDKRTDRSKGFGFVEFADEAAATTAVEAMNGKDFGGRNIVVNIARPPRVEE
jgi:RNA recognition motif-containing protein